MKVLITGACGFIGSSFVRNYPYINDVMVLDKMTYAANIDSVKETGVRVRFTDICDLDSVMSDFEYFRPAIVVNFAAESHVDRSIHDDTQFWKTNVEGVRNLLKACHRYNVNRFVQVSTDEVYGQIHSGEFTEESQIGPRNPYSASKAAAEHVVMAHHHTFKLDTVITRGSNTYGPFQFPEKLIPVIMKKLLANEQVPVYGDGQQEREWLYVDDHALGIMQAMLAGKTGHVYNISGGHGVKNIDLIRQIIQILRTEYGKTELGDHNIRFVEDRPGHDVRYAMSSEKIMKLGWDRQTPFHEGIRKTIDHYMGVFT